MVAMQANTGDKTFRELREDGCIYVDKTMFAEGLLSGCPPQASIILHPHGFGKTLGMSMLRDFCDIRQDSRAIFEGLAISENKEVCDRWMNQYPVVLVSFKDVGGETCEQALKSLASAIGAACREFAFLTDSEAVYETDRRDIRVFMEEQASRVQLSCSLYTLCRALQYHFGKRAVVLIDDYDVPLIHAQNNRYYDEMAQFLGSLYGETMKGNEWLEFGVLTGFLPYTNHNDFGGGFNNFAEYWPSHALYAGRFGFTSEEADKLLAATGFTAKKDEIQDWYKGYHMGKDADVCCPRDIMACIAALQENPEAKPDQFLCHPGEQEFLQEIVDGMTAHDMSLAEDLLTGMCLYFDFDGKQYFPLCEHDSSRIWYLLYLAGFLTMATKEQQGQRKYSSWRSVAVVIPSKRLRTLLIGAIDRNFREKIAGTDKTELFRSFWAGDATALEDLLDELLRQTATYYDVYDGYYHDFLTGLFAGTGCEGGVNGGQGQDKQEIVIPDPANNRCAVIGIEYAGDYDFSAAAAKALSRARDRAEAEQLKGRFKNVVLWGMSFCRHWSSLMAE